MEFSTVSYTRVVKSMVRNFGNVSINRDVREYDAE